MYVHICAWGANDLISRNTPLTNTLIHSHHSFCIDLPGAWVQYTVLFHLTQCQYAISLWSSQTDSLFVPNTLQRKIYDQMKRKMRPGKRKRLSVVTFISTAVSIIWKDKMC